MGNMGLIALGYNQDNIFDAAYKQGIIAGSTFILQLSDEIGGSKLYFDSLPPELVQSTVYSPIITSTHLWAIKCYGVLS